jgi:hypothetical protein
LSKNQLFASLMRWRERSAITATVAIKIQ